MKKPYNTLIKPFAIAMVASLPFLTGCTGPRAGKGIFGSYGNTYNINAKIQDGVLHDPYGRFAIPVPRLIQPGAVVNGHLTEEGGTVGFSDDLGALIRVDVSSPTMPIDRKILAHPNWQAVYNRHRVFMGQLYKSVAPQAKLIHQEFIKSGPHNLDYYVFHMPEGSSLENRGTGKRLDAHRATLTVIRQNSLYTLATQHNPPPFGGHKPDPDDLIPAMKATLLEIYKGMAFTATEQDPPPSPLALPAKTSTPDTP